MAETNGNLFIGSLVMIVVVAVIVTIILIALKEEDSSTEQVVQAVAVGRTVEADGSTPNGSTMLYSYDGKKWNIGSGASFNYNVSSAQYVEAGVNYGNNIWVATGWNKDNNKNILYSNNGINWKEGFRNDGATVFYNGPDSVTNLRGNAVSYGKDKWVAVGKAENDQNILYSTNGICWDVAVMLDGTSIFPGVSRLDGGKGIAYGKDKWVAVGKAENNDGNILYSTNGISWQKALMSDGTSPFISSISETFSAGLNVIYNENTNHWLAVGTATNDDNLLVSSDGISWVVRNATLEGGSFFNNCEDIAYSSEKNAYIATGDNGGSEQQNLAFSNDSITWEAATMANGISFPFDNTLGIAGLAVNYSNNLDLWLATGGNGIGQSGGAVITSSNGISWNTTIMANGTSYPFGPNNFSTAYDIAVRN